jgi:hypothetical protein
VSFGLFNFTIARDGARFALYRQALPGTDTDRRWHLVTSGTSPDVAQAVATAIAPHNVTTVEHVQHLHTDGAWSTPISGFAPLAPRERVEAEIADLEAQATQTEEIARATGETGDGGAADLRGQATTMRHTLDVIYGTSVTA